MIQENLAATGIWSMMKKVPSPIKLLAIVMLIFEFGFGFIDPWWSIYINDITHNLLLTSLIISTFSLAGLVIVFPLGKVIDQFDHKKIIRLSLWLYLLVSILYLIAGYLESTWLVWLTVGINGISSIMIFETSQAYIDRHYSGDRAFNFSYYLSLDALGFLLGTGAVLAVVSWWPLYYGFVVVFLFTAFSLMISNRLQSTDDRPVNYSNLITDMFSWRYLLKAVQSLKYYYSFFYIQIISVFLLFFINFCFIVFIPLVGLEENLSLLQIGIVSVVYHLPIFLSLYYTGLVDRWPKKLTILIFFWLVSFLFLIFYIWHGQATFWLVGFLISLSLTILNLVIRPVLFKLSPPHLEGETAALTKLAEKLGTILSPLFVGLMAASFGFRSLYLFLAAVVFVMGTIVYAYYHRYYHNLGRADVGVVKHWHRSGN